MIRAETASDTARNRLNRDAFDPALLLRILAAGMDERAMLRRVFCDALAGSRFPEAGGILWHVSREPGSATGHEFTIIAGDPWLGPLEDAESWSAQAWLPVLTPC